MIIINLDKHISLEKGLKVLKQKVIKSKQNEILKDKKEYTKKSEKIRLIKKKAIYKQNFLNKTL